MGSEEKSGFEEGDLYAEEVPSIDVVKLKFSKTVKLDWSTLEQIKLIALFEHTKPASWMRDTLIKRVRTYERNPAFKRFIRELAERRERK